MTVDPARSRNGFCKGSMENPLFAFALILVGLLLMAAELVLYTHGVLSMIGLAAIIVGAVMVFGRDPILGMATLLALVVAVPLLGRVLLSLWPNTPIGRLFVLNPPREQTTIADTPESRQLEQLRGRYGRTLSPLRPAGMVDFDGRRVDAIREGTLIDAGEWVRCVTVRVSTVVVRLADGPPKPADLEEMTL
jgi:membrane-bound ClpP family serine protease